MTPDETEQLTRQYCAFESQLHALTGGGDPIRYNAVIDQLRAMILHPDVRLEYAPMEESKSETTPDPRAASRGGAGQAVIRRLLKITRYTHADYADLFATYLSSPLPPDLSATDLAVCLWWGETETGKKGIVCRYYWPRIPGRERRWHFQSGDESVKFDRLSPQAQWWFTSPTGDPNQEAEYLSKS